jgi:hypothetical protein
VRRRYFGAARDLPGVRELFEQAEVKKERMTRAKLMKRVDADYYGMVMRSLVKCYCLAGAGCGEAILGCGSYGVAICYLAIT